MGIEVLPFNHRENRRSLAILFAEEIAHLGVLKIARFCGGAVKIAAATQTVEGRFLCISIQKLQIGGRQSFFGGCQFTFWRVPIYILEAETVLGVLYRKGVIPNKGGTLDSRES